MGIRNLYKIIQTKAPNSLQTKPLSAFIGYRVAIDASIFLYKFMYVYGNVIDGLTRLTTILLKNGILPVYVFDGKPPKEKSDVLKERKEKRDELVLISKTLGKVSLEKEKNPELKDKNEIVHIIKTYIENDLEYEYNENFLNADEWNIVIKGKPYEINKLQDSVDKKIIYIRQEHIDDSKKLLDLFGVPYIIAQSEAESLCAVLCKKGIVDATLSEDSDVLATGGCILLKNFTMEKGGSVTEVCLDKVLKEMNMNYDEFLDMCILCGCDYTSKINGIGPMNAYKLIQKHKTIENIIPTIKSMKNCSVPNDFDYITSRELFKTACETDDFEIYKTSVLQTPIQITSLLAYLQQKCPKLKGKIFADIQELKYEYKNEKLMNSPSNNDEESKVLKMVKGTNKKVAVVEKKKTNDKLVFSNTLDKYFSILPK
jgi:flap endonuclease-1